MAEQQTSWAHTGPMQNEDGVVVRQEPVPVERIHAEMQKRKSGGVIVDGSSGVRKLGFYWNLRRAEELGQWTQTSGMLRVESVVRDLRRLTVLKDCEPKVEHDRYEWRPDYVSKWTRVSRDDVAVFLSTDNPWSWTFEADGEPTLGQKVRGWSVRHGCVWFKPVEEL